MTKEQLIQEVGRLLKQDGTGAFVAWMMTLTQDERSAVSGWVNQQAPQLAEQISKGLKT